MTYHEVLRYLDSFVNYEKKGCDNYSTVKLARMQRLAEAFGNPHEAIRSIHIGGTKGKGSTAAMVHSILRRSGLKVGLYTSPHLITVRERIQVNEGIVSEEDMVRLVEEVKAVVDALPDDAKPTFFELYTLLAFLHFRAQRVDCAVYEVGMGGRLDATNIITPLVSGITSISYDHTPSLGTRLGEIAGEKAGIIKDRALCVIGPQEDESLEVIESTARLRDAHLFRVGKEIFVEEVPSGMLEEVCNIFGIFGEYPLCTLGLLGEHQTFNAATAVGIVEALRYWGIMVHQDAIREGLRLARWPGRLEIVARDPYIVLDGAHNRASARFLAQAIRKKFTFNRLFLILGISKDKDMEGIVEELEPVAHTVIVTRSGVASRAGEPSTIKKYIRQKKVILTERLQEALDAALAGASAGDMIVVTGSLYLVGEAKAIFSPI